MSWTDEELDDLFRSAGESGKNFSYKDEYWKEMETLLPVRAGGRDFIWYFTAFLFTGVLTMAFLSNDRTLEQQKLAKNEFSDHDASDKNASKNEDLSYSTAADNTSMNETVEKNSTATSFSLISPPANVKGSFDLSGSETEKQEFQQVPVSNELQHETFRLDVKQVLPIRFHSDHQLLPLHEKAKAGGFGPAFYIQSVAGISQSLITPSEDLTGSFGLGAGIALRSGNFVANFGLNALVSNHSDLHLTRSAKVYGFGSSMYRYDFNYKQLYYLEGNLEAGYQVGRSEIKFGIRPSYLMSSKVRIASTEYNSISGSEEWSEEEQVYSFTKGLNRWGIKSSIGCAYHIKPDLEIGAQIGVQLMNSVDEEYIQGTPKMVPIDGQFYLRKNIGWKRK